MSIDSDSQLHSFPPDYDGPTELTLPALRDQVNRFAAEHSLVEEAAPEPPRSKSILSRIACKFLKPRA